MLSRRTVYRVVALSALTALGSGQAHAQAASNLVPSTFEPSNQRSAGTVRVAREPGAAVPEGADRLFVTVGEVRIDGGLPQMAGANAAFVEGLSGKRVPVSEIFLATGRLESAYANAGYVLSRVVLPQQTLRDGGTLRIVVIDGFIEEVDASRVPPEARERATGITQPLVGQRSVRLQEIERALLLAGDTYGARLSSTLSAGLSTGGTVLTLDGEFRRFTGFVGADNTLSDELGGVNLSFGAEINGALSMGETFYFRAGGSPVEYFSDDARYRYLSAGTVFPIGFDGLTFNVEGTWSNSTPDQEFFPNTSAFERLSFRLYYPWIRARQTNLSSQLILDRVSDSQDLLVGSTEFPIYDDDLSVLRLTIDGTRNFEDGSFLQADAVLSVGLDAFGARADVGPDDTPMSRQGASAEFTKLVLGARYERPFAENWIFSVNGRIQDSFGDPLVTSEQFSIANPFELSTFDAGEILGDDGWVVRSQVGRSRKLDLFGFPLLGTLYAFGAYGEVRLEEPTFFEQEKTTAYSYGIGADLLTIEESQYRSGSLRLEYGRGERDDLEPDGNRFTILASRRF